MATHGSGEQHVKEGHHTIGDYVHNPLQSTPVGDDVGGTGTTVHTGDAGTHNRSGGVAEQIKEKLPGAHHDDHKAATTTTGDHGVADGHEKKGVMEKIKEKIPGGQQ